MSSRTTSFTAGTTVAFDLGANAVRVVEVEWTGADGAGHLAKRGSAPLPVNIWNDLPAGGDAFVAALKQAMSSAGISAKSVVACLPRRLVTLRFARLPHAPPEQMRGLVAFEAQQYVLFPLDEVILDYHVVTEGANGMPLASEDDMESVLLAAARRTLITDLIALFERAGLELEQLTVSALALAEHIRESIEPTALLDVEPGEMDVAVVANRQLLFTRASGLDVSGAHPEIAALRLADEVARTFTSFQNEYRQQTLAHIYLSGPSVQGADGAAVEQTLRSVLEMPIDSLRSRLLPPTDPEARAYATAVGAAMQTRPNSLASINLVPDERAIRKAQAQQRRQQQYAVLVGLLVVGLLVYGVQHTLAASAKAKAVRLDANEKYRKFNDAVEVRRKQFQRTKDLYAELNTGLDRDHPSVDVLVALNRTLPTSADIWLTQFAFDRTGIITIHGETKSAAAATEMVIALQDSGAFTDVKLAYMGDAQENNTVSNSVPSPAAPVAAASNIPTTPLPGLTPANPVGAPPSNPGSINRGGNPPMNMPGASSGGPPVGFPANMQQPAAAPGGFPPGFTPPPGFDPSRFRQLKMQGGLPNEATPVEPPKPQFYLIGYGQAAQDTQSSGPTAAPADAEGTPNAGNGGRRRRKRLPADGGVTPNPSASSNRVQGGTAGANPPGSPNTMPGQPMINPAAGSPAMGTTKPTLPGTGTPKPGVAVKPIVKAPVVATPPKGTLTSFIITCRLNPNAKTLLIKENAKAAGGKKSRTGTASKLILPNDTGGDSPDMNDTGGETDATP